MESHPSFLVTSTFFLFLLWLAKTYKQAKAKGVVHNDKLPPGPWNEVAKLIRSIQMCACEGSQVNISKTVFSLVSTIVSRAAVGKKSEHEDQLLDLLARNSRGGFDLADLLPSMKHIHLITGMKAKLEDMHKEIDKILQDIISELRSKSNNGKGEAEDRSCSCSFAPATK